MVNVTVVRNEKFFLYTAIPTPEAMESDPTITFLKSIQGFNFDILNYADPNQHEELNASLESWRPVQPGGEPNSPLKFPFMVYQEIQSIDSIMVANFPSQVSRFIIGHDAIIATNWLSLQNI